MTIRADDRLNKQCHMVRRTGVDLGEYARTTLFFRSFLNSPPHTITRQTGRDENHRTHKINTCRSWSVLPVFRSPFRKEKDNVMNFNLLPHQALWRPCRLSAVVCYDWVRCVFLFIFACFRVVWKFTLCLPRCQRGHAYDILMMAGSASHTK